MSMANRNRKRNWKEEGTSMKNSWLDKLIRYGKAHLTQKHWKGILAVLACAAVLCTAFALAAPAMTVAGDTESAVSPDSGANADTDSGAPAGTDSGAQTGTNSGTQTDTNSGASSGAPAKAAPAETTGDARPVITVTTDNSKSHGNLTFYTGEAATTTLTISNPVSAQIAEDDGTVVRVYMEFAKTNPGEGHPASADGAPSQAAGTYTVVSNTGKSYAYTVTRIDGTDSDHYTYCMEFQRPLQGDTISINLPSGYPSPTSAGGTNTVWGVVLTKEEKEALDTDGKTGIAPKPENGENTQKITWETKADEFAVKKEPYRSPSIKSDGNGGYYVSGLNYNIRTSRSTTKTLEGQGKDYVTAVTYTDTFTLPEGVNFSQDVIDAIKNDDLTYNTNYDDKLRYLDGDYGSGFKIKSTNKLILLLGKYNYFESGNPADFTVSLDDAHTMTISWVSHNLDPTHLRPISDKVPSDAEEYEAKDFKLAFADHTLVIPKLNETGTYTFQNAVSSDWHYCWSSDQKKDASCKATVSAGEAKFEMSKDERNSGFFGSPTEYLIYLSNKGTLPYEKLCYVKDPLPDTIYLTADGMEKLFTDKNHFGEGASILISDATFCPDGTQHQTVTGIDGKTTGTTAARNTSADSDGKYSGCSNSKQHPEDHTGIIDIRWNQDHTNLVLSFTKADGSTSTRTCAADAASIQAALDAEHYLVTNFTHYTVEWDLRDENGKPRTIYGGQSIAIPIYARSKDTFMRLEQDWPGSYPKSHVYAGNNTAYAYGAGMSDQQDKDKLASASCWSWSRSRTREFYLSKDAILADGKAMTKKHVPKDGETVDYRLSVKHVSTGSYDILPLTDHMFGAQVLLAEVGKNKTAAWTSGCEIYTAADGTQYYKLNRAGTYAGVWLGDKYADSVTVTKNTSGRDTLIKWYFTNYTRTRTDTVSYKALVCPKELKIEGLTYSLNNESWLGDHQTHRLYATIGEVRGLTLEFNKKIVPESDVQAANDAKAEGEDYCPVSDGQTVYYRFMFKADAPEAEEDRKKQPATVTLTGSQLRDALPLGLSKDGTDYLKWKKGTKDAANAQPGDVWIVGYQNATDIQGEGNWDIADTKTENQQEIHWDKNFSVSFTSEHPLYVYVRLTFPKGADWQEYAAQYGSTELVNTLYVDGVPDSVTHDLKTQAKAVLQKSVYTTDNTRTQSSYYGYDEDKKEDSLFYYQNNDAVYHRVCYSVVLYNDGGTRLYINDMQDILPRGFTFDGFYYDYPGSHGNRGSKSRSGSTGFNVSTSLFYPNSGADIQYKVLAIDTDVQTINGVQLLTFRFKKSSSESYVDQTPSYDEKREKFYLNPGEAISFGYYANTNERKDTDDVAVNSIAMPYYDYTGGGLSVGNTTFHRKNPYESRDYSSYTPNDGSCTTIDNTQAVASGRTGVSNDTQWLYSQVKQVRGEIKPGITKKLTAAVKTDGTVVKDPLAAHPTDTLRWSVTAANDGHYPIYDYVLSDTMQEPYQFDGNVSYTIYGADQKVYGNYNLFSISTPDADGKAELTCHGSGTGKFSLTVNGEPELTTYEAYSGSGDRDFKYQIRLTKNKQTGRYTLSIRFSDDACAIPAGGTGVLTLETKRTDNRLVNTVFTNTCFITPMEQTWDNTTNKGNMTTLNDVFGEDNKPSVRNSAPVTTAYGYVTSSRKSVEEKENPSNKASCDTSPNYIVLPKKNSVFTYTLNVDAPEKAMDKLVLIDGLPEIGDHSSFQNDDPRFSEFKVGLADKPNVTVTVTDEDGTARQLTPDRFTVEYSTKTEYDSADWKGDSAWNSSPANARSLRVKILDESGKLVPAKSHVSVRFDANIKGDAAAGQIAWNSFGYNYSVTGDPSELEAAPLKVGVMIPTAPEMEKTVVDPNGTPAAVNTDKTFRFLLYTGTSLKETDEAKLAAALTKNNRKAALMELTVKAGQSTSDRLKLDELKVCDYENGQWKQTDTDWTWENGKTYTIVELPGDDPAYTFGSINNNAAAGGFQFTYKNDQATVLSAVNTLNTWDFTIHKTDAESGSALKDAWFALYSADPSDRMTEDAYNALSDKPGQRPDFTLTTGEGENAKTWYLTRIGRTQGKDGTLVWDNLLRDEYRYKEIQAPKGYKLDSTIRTATKTDLTHETTIENKSLRIGASVHPPEMGGAGTGWFLMGGVLLLAVGLLVYGLKRKKETR